MKFWWICLVCIFYSGTIEASGINEVEDFEKELLAKNAVAQKMVDTYRSLKTYEAVWNTDPFQKGNTEQNIKFETKILFDRKTNNAVYLMNSITSHEDGEKEEKLSILVTKNKNRLSVYSDIGLSQEPIIKELIKTDPNEITYRDIRKAIFLFYPTDLAMIMSNTPLHEALQGSPESCSTEISDTNEIVLNLVPRHETGAALVIDPNTYLINKYNFFDKATGAKRDPVFNLVSVEIDKPIDSELFDFDIYLNPSSTVRGLKSGF